jgi:hypothetical protein
MDILQNQKAAPAMAGAAWQKRDLESGQNW